MSEETAPTGRAEVGFGPEFRAGCRAIAPAAIAAVPIGLLFGAVAATKGLSPIEVALMSVLVFAGGAQFAAIEAWAYPVPIAALVFATLLIKARHVLMGASLAPKIRATRMQKLFGAWILTDETWAMAEHRALAAQVSPAFWLGMAVVLAPGWIGPTTLGAFLGPLLGDPQRLGADFAFTALFIGLIAGFGGGRSVLLPAGVSAAVAAFVYTVVGSPWHVMAGALAGVAAAFLSARGEARA